MEKKEINAIHDDELDSLLKKIGVFNDYKDKKLYCCFCKDIIREDNFYAILPEKDDINFCCDKKACIEKINIFK
jgi:hypothetical protein